MKTQLQLLCNRTFKTRTQDEMHIEFHKIRLAYQAHEKHTQDEMHLTNNFLVALIKETRFLKLKYTKTAGKCGLLKRLSIFTGF